MGKSTEKRDRWKSENLEKSKPITPKTERQREYIKAICQFETVISLGSAGTGKTFVAASIAAERFIKKEISKIVLTRPLVSVGKTAGLLPGTLDEKLEPWFRPVLDVLKQKLGPAKFEIARNNNSIELAPFEQMQGRSFNDAFVILDEAQNCTEFELKMFLTRLGENCQTVVNGDIKQKSLKEESGLKKVIQLVEKYDLPVPVVEFTPEDIVRSDQCKMWIRAWEDSEC